MPIPSIKYDKELGNPKEISVARKYSPMQQPGHKYHQILPP